MPSAASAWSRADTARFVRVPGHDDDKYSRGVVGLRTGSTAYPGAAVLGVEAAWRTGAGFVRYIGPGRAADAVLARRPETVVSATVGGARVGAWVIGSGTDAAHRGPEDAAEVRDVLTGDAPVIVDAGALDLAADEALSENGVRAPLLLTPHRREFDRLRRHLGLAALDDREQAAIRMAEAVDAVVLLKGARAIIAAPDGAVIAVEAGTPWLSTAGTGDVLGGVLGAIVAANPDARLIEAAAAGAWLHGAAARHAAGLDEGDGAPGRPIVALDVAESLPHVVAGLLR
ncbi:NAD(P)H-hydrate dehydratase [Microbacterium sp. NPDC089695]|uniref:ADP-dependent NAD(P)H-hydrate dehydratase n=1 Tax=Microbacterium sp. NPDC089695 TaxID=3364198 RepID=UPI0037F2D191